MSRRQREPLSDRRMRMVASRVVCVACLTFAILASHRGFASQSGSINCGIIGPANAKITCPMHFHANCWCAVQSFWGKAQCNCQPDRSVPLPTPVVRNCSFGPYYNVGCTGEVAPHTESCKTSCAPHYHGVCTPFQCTPNSSFRFSSCNCLPGD